MKYEGLAQGLREGAALHRDECFKRCKKHTVSQTIPVISMLIFC